MTRRITDLFDLVNQLIAGKVLITADTSRLASRKYKATHVTETLGLEHKKLY
jgi:SepF-like predicted cell division protein (DUF552 family)